MTFPFSLILNVEYMETYAISISTISTRVNLSLSGYYFKPYYDELSQYGLI